MRARRCPAPGEPAVSPRSIDLSSLPSLPGPLSRETRAELAVPLVLPPGQAAIVLPAQSWRQPELPWCPSMVWHPDDEVVLRRGCSRGFFCKEPDSPPAASSSERVCLPLLRALSISSEPHGWNRVGGHSESRRALPPARHPETHASRTCLSHRDERCPHNR